MPIRALDTRALDARALEAALPVETETLGDAGGEWLDDEHVTSEGEAVDEPPDLAADTKRLMLRNRLPALRSRSRWADSRTAARAGTNPLAFLLAAAAFLASASC